jgi:hypothetical protein
VNAAEAQERLEIDQRVERDEVIHCPTVYLLPSEQYTKELPPAPPLLKWHMKRKRFYRDV